MLVEAGTLDLLVEIPRSSSMVAANRSFFPQYLLGSSGSSEGREVNHHLQAYSIFYTPGPGTLELQIAHLQPNFTNLRQNPPVDPEKQIWVIVIYAAVLKSQPTKELTMSLIFLGYD